MADRLPILVLNQIAAAGLSRLPVIGRLFSYNRDTVNKTEVVLLITPRLVLMMATPRPLSTRGSSPLWAYWRRPGELTRVSSLIRCFLPA